ncbi:unnamed protein product [Schistocephalus solidus]|uniref:Protein SYS1 homolog n=1 Tax=Schistocephalus solidus TaxID=70667 RepID=A0A0X3PNB7_SCHSO|nr:unnamed protein product [Schistocephalus solidus]
MAYGFRSSVWDPVLIISQIVCIQCLYYGAAGALLALISPVSSWQTSLSLIFDDEELRFRDAQGRCLIAVFLLAATACALGLWRLVKRTKLCLDFACTLHFWHLIFCWAYNASFPVSVAWWFTTVISIILMTVLGEFLCMRSEMKAIPLGGAGAGSQRSAV